MNDDDLRARLAFELRRLGTAEDVPGASVALVRGAHFFEESFGVLNSRTGVEVTPDSLFQIQSITKVLTATLVMQLVDEGLVHLDAPVRSYLPGFRTADVAASDAVTVRHLLTHTGGFEGDLWAPTTSGPDALERFVADLVANAAQNSQPGDRFSYCNAGFGTLGRLIEVMRGGAYEQALRRHLAEPLGIEPAFTADQALAFRTAIGHVRPAPSAPLRPTRAWAVMPPSNPAAGNQLAMSARGLLAVGRLHLSNGRTPEGRRLVSEASCRSMREPQLEHPGGGATATYQGLGWRLTRPGVVEHRGGSLGVAAILRVVPGHDLAAVVLTNADSGSRLITELLDPLFDDLTGSQPDPVSAVPPHEVRVRDPKPLLGRYGRRQAEIDVTQDAEGRLWLTSRPQHESVTMAQVAGIDPMSTRSELRPVGDDAYVLVGTDEKPSGIIRFVGRTPDGLFESLVDDRAAFRVR